MIMLIGYGNHLRRDDGAGPALARMIEAWSGPADLKVITPHQLVPELAENLATSDVTAVLFLDASIGDCEGKVLVSINPLKAGSGSPSLGHFFSAADLLCYTELLRGSSLPAWQVTVPGIDFGYGEGLSVYSGKNLATAFKKLLSFLQKISLL
ncbi:MAG: hydrogenase [Geobacteraceae bacterium]